MGPAWLDTAIGVCLGLLAVTALACGAVLLWHIAHGAC